jgi:hypothetical protein
MKTSLNGLNESEVLLRWWSDRDTLFPEPNVPQLWNKTLLLAPVGSLDLAAMEVIQVGWMEVREIECTEREPQAGCMVLVDIVCKTSS